MFTNMTVTPEQSANRKRVHSQDPRHLYRNGSEPRHLDGFGVRLDGGVSDQLMVIFARIIVSPSIRY